MLKYEIWLNSTLVATTKTYKLARRIFNILHKQCPTTDLYIADTETNTVLESFNCF